MVSPLTAREPPGRECSSFPCSETRFRTFAEAVGALSTFGASPPGARLPQGQECGPHSCTDLRVVGHLACAGPTAWARGSPVLKCPRGCVPAPPPSPAGDPGASSLPPSWQDSCPGVCFPLCWVGHRGENRFQVSYWDGSSRGPSGAWPRPPPGERPSHTAHPGPGFLCVPSTRAAGLRGGCSWLSRGRSEAPSAFLPGAACPPWASVP